MVEQNRNKQFIVQCWLAAVHSVNGENATRHGLSRNSISSIDNILAVGKAASSMCLGALNFLSSNAQGLVITKYDHTDARLIEDNRIRILESAHPVPDQNSLIAGSRAIEFVQQIPAHKNLVLLVSGGASSLLESLPEGLGLEDLTQANKTFLSGGFDIEQINALRVLFSGVKGGRLLDHFGGRQVLVLAISDVPTDDIEVIGSGIGGRGVSRKIDFEVPASIQRIVKMANANSSRMDLGDKYQVEIIASNAIARNAASDYAQQEKFEVKLNEFTLNQSVADAADMISKVLIKGEEGVYIWGGEPTIVLPENPGQGGRSQSLGLMIAEQIAGYNNISVIVAGTDGSDGPTDAAGAVVDGNTFHSAQGASLALQHADAGNYLEEVGALYKSGPTGTNVMDLVIAVVG